MSKAEDGTFSVRGLIRLIIPLMIGLTLALIVGIIDSVMLSGSGEAAVSGLSLLDSLIQLLIYIFAALAVGGAIIAGQYLGARLGNCNARLSLDGGVWMRKGVVNPAK